MLANIIHLLLQLMPESREDFIEYLISIDYLDEAAKQMAIIVNDEKFQSARGKTAHQVCVFVLYYYSYFIILQLWTELCELISKNPLKIHSLAVDPIIRQGIKRYTDQVGQLWCSLAEYYIRAANFEKARDIFEEAILTVKTVRDFTQVCEGGFDFWDLVTFWGCSHVYILCAGVRCVCAIRRAYCQCTNGTCCKRGEYD
jgi:pre-mRNA-splicing factor SYF1